MSQRAHPYAKHVVYTNRQFEDTNPEYNNKLVRRDDRSRKADDKEKQRLAKFESITKPIDYIVFIACHSATVDDFSFGTTVRNVATFPFETVLASHLGMPTIRYPNHVIYEWMCKTHIPQIIDAITKGHTYTGEAIFQDDGLFDNIFTEGSPKKIRFVGDTTADLKLFMPDSDAQHSSDPDGIFVFNLDAKSADTDRCKDIAPEILTSVSTPDGNRYQTVKLSTLFSVLWRYFTKPEYNEKRILIMLGSCRSVPNSFYRELQSTSGSSSGSDKSDSEGGRNTRRSRRIKKTRRRGTMSRRNIRNRTSRRRR